MRLPNRSPISERVASFVLSGLLETMQQWLAKLKYRNVVPHRVMEVENHSYILDFQVLKNVLRLEIFFMKIIIGPSIQMRRRKTKVLKQKYICKYREKSIVNKKKLYRMKRIYFIKAGMIFQPDF
jgi:hypothetical protein